MTDKCVEGYKHKKPMMKQNDRRKIIDSLKPVYKTIFQDSFEFPRHVIRLKKLHGKNFIIFDSKEHCRKFADIVIPRTQGISSTLFKKRIKLVEKKYESHNIKLKM